MVTGRKAPLRKDHHDCVICINLSEPKSPQLKLNTRCRRASSFYGGQEIPKFPQNGNVPCIWAAWKIQSKKAFQQSSCSGVVLRTLPPVEETLFFFYSILDLNGHLWPESQKTVTARTTLKFQRARKDNSKCPQKKSSIESTFIFIEQEACKLPWNWVLFASLSLTTLSLPSLDATAAYARLSHPPRKPANFIQWGRISLWPLLRHKERGKKKLNFHNRIHEKH